jgi:hypothetical protein
MWAELAYPAACMGWELERFPLAVNLVLAAQLVE